MQIYITDFSGPYHRLKERNLISQEDNQYQYRFRDIVDLDSGKPLFTVEHEVRSATHLMFMRPLVNRNPAETNPPTRPATSNGLTRWGRMSMTGGRSVPLPGVRGEACSAAGHHCGGTQCETGSYRLERCRRERALLAINRSKFSEQTGRRS